MEDFNQDIQTPEKEVVSEIEDVIKILSTVILVIGIATSIFLAFTIIVVEEPSMYGKYIYSDEVFNPEGLVITIATLLSSILLFALLRLAVGVSINIRKIAKALTK